MGGSGIEPHYPVLGFQFLHIAGCVIQEVFFLSDFQGHSLIVKLDSSFLMEWKNPDTVPSGCRKTEMS